MGSGVRAPWWGVIWGMALRGIAIAIPDPITGTFSVGNRADVSGSAVFLSLSHPVTEVKCLIIRVISYLTWAQRSWSPDSTIYPLTVWSSDSRVRGLQQSRTKELTRIFAAMKAPALR
jgi:hypothetical protein